MTLKNQKEEIKGIVFDFDFTLGDSSKGVVECVNYAFKMLKFKTPSKEKIKGTIGLTLEHTFMKLLGNQHLEKIELFKKYFIIKANEVMAERTELYDSTPNVVQLLKSFSIKLGIVSTKFRYRIETILKREDILNLFEVIIGGEDVQKLKPNPEGLLEAIKRLNLSSSEVFYVGDSIVDAETAYRAGIPFIAVLSGMTTRKEFKKHSVKQIIKTLSELPNLLC